MTSFIKLSEYQEAVIAWFKAALQNKRSQSVAVVKSVAGSGKTFIIQQLTQIMPYTDSSRVVYLAFNNEIVKEMTGKQKQGKIPNFIDIRTNHSLGLANVGMCRAIRLQKQGNRKPSWPKVDANKDYDLIKRLSPVECEDGKDWDPNFYKSVIVKIVSLAKGQGWVNPGGKGKGLGKATDKNLRHLVRYHVIAFPDDQDNRVIPYNIVFSWVREVLEMALDDAVVSFDDMIWLPIALGNFAKKKFFMFIDECQDLNPCTRALIKLHLHRTGKAVFVGDENQSINGWCGADSESISRIISEFKADELRMSVTYRNSLDMVDHLRQYIPDLEAAPNAIKGRVDYIDSVDFTEITPEESLFICRYTAPLISACLSLLSAKVPAHVRGRDIAKGLIGLIDGITSKQTVSRETFDSMLNDWHQKQLERAEKEDHEANADFANDRFSGLSAISATCADTDEIKATIETMFAQGNGYCFTTGHRSKGLECKTAVILTTGPNNRAIRKWQKQQENCVNYVMESRATHELLFIDPEDFAANAEFAGNEAA